MRCPECNGKIINGCCVKCGRLENGNHTRKEYKTSRFEAIRRYNRDFDKMYHNENWPVAAILGPLYFSYKRHSIVGYLLGVFEYSLFYFGVTSTFWERHVFLVLDVSYFAYGFILLLILLHASFSNVICILLDKLRMSGGFEYAKDKSFLSVTITIAFYVLTAVLVLRFR